MPTTLQLDRPVTGVLTSPGFTLRAEWTIDQALSVLRSAQPAAVPASPVIYFYVVDEADRLVGVLPTRRLILAPAATRIRDLMTRDLITLRPADTLFDALELFAMHRLLALPVVDAAGRFLGIVEVSLYTDEVFDLAQNQQLNEVFQLIGLHLERHKHGSAWRGFRLRMPWLLSNIAGGLVCAALGALFEATLQKVVLIALFIPLILTLAESIAVQSMTLAIEQAAAGRRFTGVLVREILTALMLGACSGAIVACVSLFWRGPLAATLTLGASVALAMLAAAMLGRVVPTLVHTLKLNPRIASGPITLALVDIATVTLYLSAATMMLV